jgi:hypothetical protein
MNKLSKAKKWFIVMAILAILSVISFFQVNSAWADEHNFNTGWKIIGGILGIGTLLSFRQVLKSSN